MDQAIRLYRVNNVSIVFVCTLCARNFENRRYCIVSYLSFRIVVQLVTFKFSLADRWLRNSAGKEARNHERP